MHMYINQYKDESVGRKLKIQLKKIQEQRKDRKS